MCVLDERETRERERERATSNWINLAIEKLCVGQYINVFANFSPSFCELVMVKLRHIAQYIFFYFIFIFNNFSFSCLQLLFLLLVLLLLLLRFVYLKCETAAFIRPQTFEKLYADFLLAFPEFVHRHLFYDSISETENAMIY